MNKSNTQSNSRIVRHRRVRAKVIGTAERPRFSVFRSNKHVFLQLVDDKKGATIVSVNDIKDKKKTAKVESAKQAGKKIAELAKAKKIEGVVFDRGGYKYHGRVKAVAEGAREGGLKF